MRPARARQREIPARAIPRCLGRALARLLTAATLLALAAPALAGLPDPQGDWRSLTPQAIRDATPGAVHGDNVEVMPLQWLYTFPSVNYMGLLRSHRQQHGNEPLEAIVVAEGTYDLDRLVELIDDPRVIERVASDTVIARRPIYVMPTAALVVRGQTLRLSLDGLAAVLYHGDLFVVDATVTTWDEARGDFGPRGPIPADELLLFGQRPARPYLLGLRGSRSYFAASRFRGLGYYGRTATFGLSMASYGEAPGGSEDSLIHRLTALPPPTGVLVGNTITGAVFGFYTNASGAVALVGNLLRDNVVYHVDPHDASRGLVIARNVTAGARHKHGIILSREVHGSTISENVSLVNAGSGFMLDRRCNDTRMTGNLAFANGGDGIAVFESHGNRIAGNRLVANLNDGIYVRNSRDVVLRDNLIDRNGHYGIEVATASLKGHARDLERDPYREETDVRIVDNGLHRNLTAAIAAKGEAQAFIRGNDLSDSAPHLFSGVLEEKAAEVLKANRGQGYHHRGQPREGP